MIQVTMNGRQPYVKNYIIDCINTLEEIII